MENILKRILRESRFLPNNRNLEGILFSAIEQKLRFLHRIKLFSYGAIGISATVLLALQGIYTYAGTFSSPKYNLLQTLLSEDLGTLFMFWKEILYLVLESIPVMSICITLGLLLMAIVSLRNSLLLGRRDTLLLSIIK